jgi:hypothetical protein
MHNARCRKFLSGPMDDYWCRKILYFLDVCRKNISYLHGVRCKNISNEYGVCCRNMVIAVLSILWSSYVYLLYCLFDVLDIGCTVYLWYCVLCICFTVCTDVFTLDAGLLARSQCSEGPATGHLDTGFSWSPCVFKQLLRWFPRFQVATTCFSCSPPDVNLVGKQFHVLYTC